MKQNFTVGYGALGGVEALLSVAQPVYAHAAHDKGTRGMKMRGYRGDDIASSLKRLGRAML
jgi:hypothetical protein